MYDHVEHGGAEQGGVAQPDGGHVAPCRMVWVEFCSCVPATQNRDSFHYLSPTQSVLGAIIVGARVATPTLKFVAVVVAPPLPPTKS